MAEHAVLFLAGLVAGLGLDGGLQPWSGPLFAVLVPAAVAIGRHRPVRGVVWALLPGGALIAVVAVLDVWEAVTAIVVAGVTVALPWSLAHARRQQVELLAAERARSDALIAERTAVAEQARLAERSRLAADIHHTLGHELALLGVRAGALELSGDSPSQRDAAAALRASAAAATDHLRRALDLLEPACPPTSVDAVVERARRAGLEVELTRVPHDTPDTEDLPEPLARLAEHVVREGIANAARHANGALITVSYTVQSTGLVLRVVNGTGRAGEPGTGRGLAQLHEQARALGAQVHAGPASGGWVTELRAPR